MTSTTGRTVLIVEDDPGVATLERRLLERAGHRVLLAGTPQEALHLLLLEDVDLMLLDYRLPGEVDGLDFYRQVRETGPDVPVILVTGFSNEATAIRALRAGVRDFVTKSVEYLDYLPEAVARVLRQVDTERQLAESEARLASVIASAKDAIIVTDRHHRMTLFNAAAERMFRCPAAEALGQPVTRFLPREHEVAGPPAGAEAGADLTSLTHHVRTRLRGVRADGEEFPVEASISRASAGGRKFHTIMVRDVTERLRAEEVLRKSEERFQLVTRATRDVIRDWDVATDTLWWSTSLQTHLGYRRHEVGPGADWWLGHVHPDDRERVVRGVRAALAGGGDAWGEEYRFRRADGEYVTVLDRGYLMRDEAGRVVRVIGSLVDVTEQRRLEAQYRQAQKMEAIGHLAGGVAHDFNNLLTVINGYSEVLLGRSNHDDQVTGMLREIRAAGERASSLTRQLLTFSRKQILAPRVLDLNRLVVEMEKMLRRLIGEDIEVATALDPALGRVKADPGQLEQVLLNLVLNARDAMPEGGQLTIETGNTELDETYAAGHAGVTPGAYVRLTVSDTGCGMDATVRSRLFEPFFTTKQAGKGTGLGLATVYGIVKQSGGHVEVYSEPGRGATFKIYLPRLPDSEPGHAQAERHAAAPRGTETVLLAEDEEGIRALGRIALQSYGYTVLEAADGQAALAVSAAHAGPIQLLVTDVVMPRMSGRKLADLLRALRPGLKVLYLSGYTDDAVVRHGVLEAGAAFLQKPFTPAVLARKMREVLDQPAPPAAPPPETGQT